MDRQQAKELVERYFVNKSKFRLVQALIELGMV